MATAIHMEKRIPRVVSGDIRARSESGPISTAMKRLAQTAAIVTGIPKKSPIAPPANAAWDIVNPIDEIPIFVMITPRIAQAIDADAIASMARHRIIFGIMNSSMGNRDL
jgi:hypothetical protein